MNNRFFEAGKSDISIVEEDPEKPVVRKLYDMPEKNQPCNDQFLKVQRSMI